ncbi:MAG TPA: nitrate reductase subunit beta [Methyloprofundus sp.]|uniref:nitrate reductase subunit beta n=1 Tax=Methyloprofundus sp. TaxID=2020875 RepID=UPI0017E14DCF|nr:nitrate reductase subunit beta [Methyloprofundus sp.]HIG64611.1 nitrate reductase subunit beta [Methyloprofundus sp.]HIL77308.1 nitrate reductase subunit beta [Methylococcales bacterium]
MKVRANFSLVMNLDKCIGCHTCSVTCKNVWTNRKGVEYAWFNNVESKPGIGYPKNWADQEQWNGGWILENGKLQLKSGSRRSILKNIFMNPNMPTMDDYYEPFTYDYAVLQNSELLEATPTARPLSLIDGHRMEKIEWGPNWEDDLGGKFKHRSQDTNFSNMEKQIYGEFEQTFLMYLPRMCNHCVNPACVAACPSGSLYKREEDGIVLVDQDKCRSWRMCISACPYKKMFYNWESGKAEKCTGCYPRVESGLPTVCSESCVGRIRYNGVMLYDADRIEELASVENDQDLYQAQLDLFLDPNDPEVIKQAKADGIPESWMDAARNSPIYKLIVDWKVAFPLHPEFRTLPMVWYVPPLSPVQSQIDQGNLSTMSDGAIPSIETLRLPMKYLANMFTAGDEKPIVAALKRMIAMRSFFRSLNVEGKTDLAVLEEVGVSEDQVREMYRYMAIANYEDRFVIPTSHEELHQEDFHSFQGQNGFSFGNDGCSISANASLFPDKRKKTEDSLDFVRYHPAAKRTDGEKA